MRQANDHPNVQTTYPELQKGMQLRSADNQSLGGVIDVFREMGEIESFGDKGVLPTQAGYNPVEYDYSEAQPGSGDNYFVVRQEDGQILYIAFSHIDRIEGDNVYVAADAVNIPDMNWQVRPDALTSIAHEYEVDSGAEPNVA